MHADLDCVGEFLEASRFARSKNAIIVAGHTSSSTVLIGGVRVAVVTGPMKHFDGGARAPVPTMIDLARGSLAEFVAMLLFVFFGCGSASSNAHFKGGQWDPAATTIIALQFGLAITVLAFATAHTSGGHINCAVTFALTIVGTCHPLRAICYVVAQLSGSVVGAALLKATTSGDASALDRTGGLGANGYQHASVTDGNAFLVEAMGTLLLVFVVLETAVNAKAVTTDGEIMVRGNKQNLAPIPIGLAVFLAHVVCIPITGCSINPTRSFGPALVAGKWDKHWMWWVAPLTGSAIASLLWGAVKWLDDADKEKTLADSSSI